MKNSLLIFRTLLVLACFSASSVQALVIDITSLPPSTSVGSVFDVEVGISGLGDSSAPSLGIFDLELNFDPAVVGFAGIVFGDTTLGDQLDIFGLGSITSSSVVSAGALNLFELSLDLPTDLDSLQASSFVLATVTFNALSVGESLLDVSSVTLGDSLGDPLDAAVITGNVIVTPRETPIPVPSTLALLLLSLIGMAYRLRISRLASKLEI